MTLPCSQLPLYDQTFKTLESLTFMWRMGWCCSQEEIQGINPRSHGSITPSLDDHSSCWIAGDHSSTLQWSYLRAIEHFSLYNCLQWWCLETLAMTKNKQITHLNLYKLQLYLPWNSRSFMVPLLLYSQPNLEPGKRQHQNIQVGSMIWVHQSTVPPFNRLFHPPFRIMASCSVGHFAPWNVSWSQGLLVFRLDTIGYATKWLPIENEKKATRHF